MIRKHVVGKTLINGRTFLSQSYILKNKANIINFLIYFFSWFTPVFLFLSLLYKERKCYKNISMSYNNLTLNIQIILQNCFECYQRIIPTREISLILYMLKQLSSVFCLFYPGIKGTILKLRIITV